jgi:hypothetical protein
MYNSGSPKLTNCTFTGNSTGIGAEGGGGMYNSGSPKLTNCTFTGNSTGIGAEGGGGMYNSGSPKLTNCILWGDSPDEIYPPESTTVVTYSDVQGGWQGEGNIDAGPCFADPCSDDYHLKSEAGRWDPNLQEWVYDAVTSPCIDAGDPNTSIGWEPYPNGGVVNMGAYGGTEEASKSYFGRPVCKKPIAGDVNGDCRVDFLDFRIMAFHWLEDNRE